MRRALRFLRTASAPPAIADRITLGFAVTAVLLTAAAARHGACAMRHWVFVGSSLVGMLGYLAGLDVADLNARRVRLGLPLLSWWLLRPLVWGCATAAASTFVAVGQS